MAEGICRRAKQIHKYYTEGTSTEPVQGYKEIVSINNNNRIYGLLLAGASV